jgi:diguanylate cyclase
MKKYMVWYFMVIKLLMIKDLFTNLAIVVSLLFLYSHIFSTSPLTKDSTFLRKILLGVVGGLFSNILMQYGIRIDTTIVDLRHIPIILLAFFGGTLPAFIGMVLVIIGRFLIGVNTSAYASVVLILLITLFSIMISSQRISKKNKVIRMLTFSNIIFTFVIIYLVNDVSLLVKLIPLYWIISYIAGFLAFYILDFIRKSQFLLEKYKSESTTDGLTGLNNVRKFDEVFNSLLDELNISIQSLSLLYIDIDFFKKINDTYGHSEGDLVLKRLGALLTESTRNFDIVSRNGGEEFTVLLPDTSVVRAMDIAENIRKSVENTEFSLSGGGVIKVTVSVGVASYKDTTENPGMLIEDADKALYVAKKTGRNKVCCHNSID